MARRPEPRVVRPGDDFPTSFTRAIFLAGPTPRSPDVPSWRPGALAALTEQGYDGVVFVPERDRPRSDYLDQLEWETRALHMADVIVFWVPRQLDTMPAFTTNVEFGHWVGTGKAVYARPEGAPKTRYLDHTYSRETGNEPLASLPDALAEALRRVGEGAVRTDGERWIPLHLWRTPLFQSWYAQLTAAGNVLREARVRWAFVLPKIQRLLAAVTWVDIWVSAENRAKHNEWIFARSDISSVVLYQRPPERQRSLESFLELPLVLIREFRSSARTEDGFVHELPGGSSTKPDQDPREVASSEVREETGLLVPPGRFVALPSRQAAATVSTHHVHVFAAALSRAELKALEARARAGTIHGNPEETEQTVVEVTTLEEMLRGRLVDWSTLGMVLQAIYSWRSDKPAVTDD